MAQQTKADQTDVDVKTEIAAERIEQAVDCTVMARDWPSNNFDVIVLTWDHDIVGDVNHYAKASIIDAVYQSGANVELHGSEDGEESLTFKLRDE